MKTRIDLDLEIQIQRSPRVQQIEGLFDVPEASKAIIGFHFDVPLGERPWKIGLIVGPSGAGKSSVAREIFGASLVEGFKWPTDKSVVDGFGGDLPIKEIAALLSSVGFSSPPGWLKPFRVLSNGERFRVNLARAIADKRPLVAIDEFSSVVDRQAARIGSHAAAKTVRRIEGKQLVAVTCHEDVLEWLQPDWVLEPHLAAFSWRELQRRPGIEIEIRRVDPGLWSLFAPHHYLTASLHQSAYCFAAFVEKDKPVAFDAWLPFVGALNGGRKGKRGHRTVCLPDYQGIGIGRALFNTIASAWCGLGFKAFSRTAHPAEIASRQRDSHLWRFKSFGFSTLDNGSAQHLRRSRTTNRRAASFEWVGLPMEKDAAAKLVGW